MFKVGSFPLIRGKITTPLASRATPGPRRGSFMTTGSRNGNYPERVPFYGFMGNVGCHLAFTLSQSLMVSPLVAGAGKSIIWYVHLIAISVALGNLCYYW